MKKLAIGCGIVLVLLIALVAGLMYAAPRIVNRATSFVKDSMKEAEEKARFEKSWLPPGKEPGEAWFPKEVASWQRTTATPFHEIPELLPAKSEDISSVSSAPADPVQTPDDKGVIKDGYGATYMLGGQRVEVKVISVTALEKEGLMARARGFTPLPENRNGSRSSFRMNDLVEMKFGDRERVYCRAFRDWFFFLHTVDGAELKPFVESWLKAIDRQPTPEAPAEEAQPK